LVQKLRLQRSNFPISAVISDFLSLFVTRNSAGETVQKGKRITSTLEVRDSLGLIFL